MLFDNLNGEQSGAVGYVGYEYTGKKGAAIISTEPATEKINGQERRVAVKYL